MPRFAALVVVAIVAAGCEAPRDWSLRPEVPAVADREHAPPSQQLRFSHTLGEGVLGDYKGTRAISRTGRLALEEASECRVTILDVATGDLVYRFGRCELYPIRWTVA